MPVQRQNESFKNKKNIYNVNFYQGSEAHCSGRASTSCLATCENPIENKKNTGQKQPLLIIGQLTGIIPNVLDGKSCLHLAWQSRNSELCNELVTTIHFRKLLHYNIPSHA